jgi:predicted Holliday junction resolvase-like endonuclease
MHRLALLILLSASVMLPGCLAKAVVDVATAPVKAVSKGVDLATTSQSEADEKRGREIRRREQRLAKLERDYEKQLDQCEDGIRRACDEARDTYAEMQQIIPTLPYEPEDD